MNFLSHFHLHNKPDDNYFTVGLTLPDLLQFQSKKLRLTRKFLGELKGNNVNAKLNSLIDGMLMHIAVDGWFHNHEFFKTGVRFIEEQFMKYNEFNSKLPHFFSHILLEIFIDRYILSVQNDTADRFYDSYKMFDFNEVSGLFHKDPDFDKEEFIKFANLVANSTFLREYGEDHLVVGALKRVCKRIDLPFKLNADDDKLAEFVKNTYSLKEKEISRFLSYAEKTLRNLSTDIISSESPN